MTVEVSQEDLQQVEDMCAVDPAYWAVTGNLKLASGMPFVMEGREYSHEFFIVDTPEVCYMKATGCGCSDGEIIKSCHGMIYGRYRQGVLYGFPTDSDMQDYSKTRWGPLIQFNQALIGKYLSIGRKKTDAADVKRICNSNLYLRGLRMLPTADGQSRQSVSATGIHVDRAILDETDQMEQEIIAKVRGRLSNAQIDGVKGKSQIVYIGNPSDEDRGIDSLWQGSDQRFWFRKCKCGTRTCAEIEFFEDPEKCIGFYPDRLTRLKNHQPIGFVRCVKCEKPIGQRHGSWIAQRPENNRRAGFNWSYLTSENQDPAHILKCYRNPPENNLGDVIRLMLGRAYSSAEERLRKHIVLSCCGSEGMRDEHSGPCAMGVDNDDRKHGVIITRSGNQRYRLIKPFVCDNFNEVLDLINRYNVRFCVGDLRPNADSARQFQKTAKSKGCTTFLCEYTDSPLQDWTFLHQTGIVKVYRTGIFDMTHRIFMNAQIVLPYQNRIIEEFAEQCCACVKSKELDKRRRIVVYRYKKTGQGNDHWRNALNYAIVAASKVNRCVEGGITRLQKKVIHHTVQI